MAEHEALKQELFGILQQKGAKLVGVANLTGLAPAGGGETVGVAVALPVPKPIVESLKTAPTKAYYDTYFALNARLDGIVEAGAAFLRAQGYRAHAHTTKSVRMDENWCTPLPHKTVATRAGLGWIGKSCLLVTKEYGSAIRLSSLTTNAPLPPSQAIVESQCGNCKRCVENCPAHALLGVKWTAGMARETLFTKEICKKVQTERMKRATGIETDLCGMCFAVCPYTQRYLNRCESEGLGV